MKRRLYKIFTALYVFIFTLQGVAYPLPQNPNVVEGEAEVSISSDNTTMNIDAQDNTIIDFDSFNINEGESVIINLPSIDSDILSRVIGTDASNIGGSLSCNGIFILVNPNGIYILDTASIDAAGLVLSTLDITDQDFLDGNYLFQKLSEEQLNMLLVNSGDITIQEGGFGVLIAGGIENEGTIIAPLGKIALATGEAVRLDISGNNLISIAIEEAVASSVFDSQGNPITTQIDNQGTLQADGGCVLLDAESLPGIFEKAINLDGHVMANRIEDRDGIIRVVASDDIDITGTLEAADIEVISDNDITVRGTITAQDDVIFNSDYDNDNIGQFRQIGGSITPLNGSIFINGVDFGKGLNLSGYPLYFIPNEGQIANGDVKYYVRSGSACYYFSPYGIYYMLVMDNPDSEDSFLWLPIGLKFLNLNLSLNLTGGLLAEPYFNYFKQDASYTDIPSYYQIIYDELYSGIDLVYTSNDGNLESLYTINPGADYSQIQVQYDNIQSLNIDPNGNLIITTDAGEIVENAPYAYQDIDGEKHQVPVYFNLIGDDAYSFSLGEYNPDVPVVIDPELTYSTFLGGDNQDYDSYSISVNSQGCAYITGYTWDGVTDFPTTAGAYDTSHNNITDVFVTKLNSNGSGLVYSTFLGGTHGEIGYSIVTDYQGNAYITGSTGDGVTDFPTTPGAYNTEHNGGQDVFVTKLNSSGNALLYSTFVGGDGNETAYSIAIDSLCNVYITGSTSDENYPTTIGAYDTSHNGSTDAFVTKLNSDLSSLIYSTFLGGSGADGAYDIAVDSQGSAYVTGQSQDHTTDFPTTPDAYCPGNNGGMYDAYVTKLNADGSGLVYSTFLGGSSIDVGYSLAVDSSGCVHVTGYTNNAATDFPTTAGAYNTTHNGNADAFIAELSSDGKNLTYSTLIGGTGNDYGYSIAIDSQGNNYIGGYTSDSATDFPTTIGAYDTTHNGNNDAFLAKLSPDLSELIYSTFIGGSGQDYGRSIVLDSQGNAYMGGYTEDAATDFPTTAGAYDTTHNGGTYDVFLLKFTFAEAEVPPPDEPNDTPEQPDLYISDDKPEPNPEPRTGPCITIDEDEGEDGEIVNVNVKSEPKTGFNYDISYERGEYNKYTRRYLSDRTYRTVVIVFEGEVLVAPYDDSGPKYTEGESLKTGQKTSREFRI